MGCAYHQQVALALLFSIYYFQKMSQTVNFNVASSLSHPCWADLTTLLPSSRKLCKHYCQRQEDDSLACDLWQTIHADFQPLTIQSPGEMLVLYSLARSVLLGPADNNSLGHSAPSSRLQPKHKARGSCPLLVLSESLTNKPRRPGRK